MFSHFAEKICEGLIEEEFHLNFAPESKAILAESTDFLLLAKNQSPLFYLVSIVNQDQISLQQYQQEMEPILRRLEENLNRRYRCSRCVCVHLVPYETEKKAVKDWIASTQMLSDSALLQVWWGINTDNGEITVGQGQPTEILNFRKKIAKAIKAEKIEDPKKTVNLADMEQVIRKKTALEVRSENNRVTKILIGINVFLFLVTRYGGRWDFLRSFFANDAFLSLSGEYYRFFTSLFLHANVTHLGYNCLSLFIFGSRIEKYFGKKNLLILYFLSGLGGSIASAYLTRGISIGASGAIYGLTGGVLALALLRRKTVDGLDYMTMLFLSVMGIGMGFLRTGIDNYAHLGGFITGFCCTILWILFGGQKSK